MFKNMPSLQVWRLWHLMNMRFLGGNTERLLPSVRESLRWREGEQAPQVLLTLPSAPYRERNEMLRRLLNYPCRTRLCPYMVDPELNDPCDPETCPYSHQDWMFDKKGRRLPAQTIQKLDGTYDRHKFVWEHGACNGEILETPGLESARIYLVAPEMPDAERSRVVSLFCHDCWASVNGMRVVVAQSRSRPSTKGFLRVVRIGADTVAQRLEDFLLTPALLIAIGKTLNVGFNLQQRATGICLTEFECDFDGLMQRCGRLQRIPRPLSPLATSKITVTMPCIRGTVEEMIFLERYNVWKENRAGVQDDQDDD